MASSHLSVLPLPLASLPVFSFSGFPVGFFFFAIRECVRVPNGAWFVYPEAIEERNNEPGYMLPYGCLGRLKLTEQMNEKRNQREIGAVISVPIMFVEPESSLQRLFIRWCPETVACVLLDMDRHVLLYLLGMHRSNTDIT